MEFIIQAARDAISARGRFSIALTGGSSPQQTYSLLAQPEHVGQIDWEKTFLFFGDDRFVPPDDERSNFGMASRLMIEHVPIPTANIYPMPVEAQDPAQAAGLYADTLAQFFAVPAGSPTPPQFDLILLGLGDDGHIASLFPGYPTLEVTDRWVVSSPAGTLPPPVDRITLTYPVLNAARQVLFMVTGGNKAEAVQDILEGGAAKEKRPAAGIQPAGELIWYLDQNAASRLAKP
jgi:6-phosphogluconolactonase